MTLPQAREDQSSAICRLSDLLWIAVCFGIFTGFIEGCGLLLFQRINWAQWGRIMHVSREILWISPLLDVSLFLLVALCVWILGLLFTAIPRVRLLLFALVFLSVYDWLVLTGRLYRAACLLLALGIAVVFLRWLHSRESAAVRFCRRSIPAAVALFLATFTLIDGGTRLGERLATAKLPAAAPGTPNVLVIVIDTLRADHVSSYGYPRHTTPQIAQLAAQGVLFENAIAPSSWSLPSHASLVTGRSPFETGAGNVQPMPWFGWGKQSLGGYPTIGEALERRGYRTGAFSANRVYFSQSLGFKRGFLHFEDYFDSPADCFIRTLYGREFSRLYLNRTEKSKITRSLRFLGLDHLLDKDSEGSGEYGGAWGVRKRADEVNRELVRWIDRDRQHPFFAFLNYLDVHYSYGGPRNFSKPAWDHGTTLDEYDAALAYVDQNIGHLLRELDQRGLRKHTMIVITSDHGESLGDHGLSYHGAALYWELVHVPLIISFPGHLPQGMRIAQPVTNAAIPATVMQTVAASEGKFPGPALNALWDAAQPPSTWPPPVSELAQTDTIVPADRALQGKIPIATDGDMKSLISGRWQFIVHSKLGGQLYDLTRDPEESDNLINTPEGRAVALALAAQLQRKTIQFPAARADAYPPAVAARR